MCGRIRKWGEVRLGKSVTIRQLSSLDFILRWCYLKSGPRTLALASPTRSQLKMHNYVAATLTYL